MSPKASVYRIIGSGPPPLPVLDGIDKSIPGVAEWVGRLEAWELVVLDTTAPTSALAASIPPPKPEDFGILQSDLTFRPIKIPNLFPQNILLLFGFLFWLVVIWTALPANSSYNHLLNWATVIVVFLIILGLIALAIEAKRHNTLAARSIRALQMIAARYEYLDGARRAEVWERSTQCWREADGSSFERLVAQHFQRAGWMVQAVGGANDGGIDLILNRNAEKVIVQCKAHAKPLGPSVVRELYGAWGHSDAGRAILATLNGVTPNAAKWLVGKPISVLQLKDFVQGST